MVQILLIGAGNLGSRHLQALKSVNIPLKIGVVDPSEKSLQIAEERYNAIKNENNSHEIEFLKTIPECSEKIYIVIIATNSNIRKSVIEELFEKNTIEFLILEKILFQNLEDYYSVEKIINESNTKAWINCPMRMVPFYKDNIKNWFENKKFNYYVTGSQYGLITNSIHYIDFMCFLLNNTDFEVDTKYLDTRTIPSKREGFQEINGILQFHFSNGSHGIFTCESSGNLPFSGNISSDSIRCLIKDTEQTALVWNSENNQTWKSFDATFPYQSQLTKIVVEKLINEKKCDLTPYKESMEIHIKFLEGLKENINKNNLKFDVEYPFT